MHFLPESLIASTVEQDSLVNAVANNHFFLRFYYIFLKSQPIVDEFNNMGFGHRRLIIRFAGSLIFEWNFDYSIDSRNISLKDF